jgi:hypothetical protein
MTQEELNALEVGEEVEVGGDNARGIAGSVGRVEEVGRSRTTRRVLTVIVRFPDKSVTTLCYHDHLTGLQYAKPAGSRPGSERDTRGSQR